MVTQEIKALAAEFFADRLLRDPLAAGAREWLQERGIDTKWLSRFETGKEKIPKRLPIGYHPGDSEVSKYFGKERYSAKELGKAGIFLDKSKSHYTGSIVFTYHLNPTQIGRFKVRTVRGSSSDTIWLGNGGKCGVFGLQLFDWTSNNDRSAIAVEGEFDCLSLQLYMLEEDFARSNVVALSGGAAGSAIGILEQLGVGKVRLLPDNDPPGVGFVSKCAAKCRERNLSCVVHKIPKEYKDPDEWIQSKNIDLRAVFGNQAVPGAYLAYGLMEYDERYRRFDQNTADGLQDARQYVVDKSSNLGGHDLIDFAQALPENIRPFSGLPIVLGGTNSELEAQLVGFPEIHSALFNRYMDMLADCMESPKSQAVMRRIP